MILIYLCTNTHTTHTPHTQTHTHTHHTRTHARANQSQALMKFPHDYPYSPPSFKFLTKMFHSNIYEVSTSCLKFTNLFIALSTPVVAAALVLNVYQKPKEIKRVFRKNFFRKPLCFFEEIILKWWRQQQ